MYKNACNGRVPVLILVCIALPLALREVFHTDPSTKAPKPKKMSSISSTNVHFKEGEENHQHSMATLITAASVKSDSIKFSSESGSVEELPSFGTYAQPVIIGANTMYSHLWKSDNGTTSETYSIKKPRLAVMGYLNTGTNVLFEVADRNYAIARSRLHPDPSADMPGQDLT